MAQHTKQPDFVHGLRDGIPIGLGYLSVSFSFGIAAVSQGLSPLTAILISATNLTSAGQMAGLGILVSGGMYAEMALAQLIINLRYALMSLSLSQKLSRSFPLVHRFFTAFGITDEIFAVASGQEGAISHRYLYGLIAIPFLGWTLGTAIGALAGNILPESIKQAFGIMIYGMFLAILLPPAKKLRPVRLVVLLAAGLSCLAAYLPALSFLSSGFSIIFCAGIAAAVGALLFPVADDWEENA